MKFLSNLDGAKRVVQDSLNRFVTDAEKATWNAKAPNSVVTSVANGLAPLSGGGTTKYLRADGTWTVPPDTNTIYTHPTGDGNLHVPATSTTNNDKVLKAGATAGSLVWGTDNDTIYTHPANHPPSIITQDTSNRFVTDTEKSTWNAKAPASHGNHVPTVQGADNAVYLRNDNTWHTLVPSDIGASTTSHIHSSFDRASAVLSGANVFSNLTVADGILSAIATRALTSGDIGAEPEIVDGSNANGYYKKFEDGTLICWGTRSATYAVNSAWGSMYYSPYQTITFPIAFVGAVPIVQAQNTNAYGEGIFVVTTSTISNFIGYVLRPSIGASGSYTTYWLAVGRWK